MTFGRNVGGVDRAVRVIGGSVLLALGAWQRVENGGGTVLLIVGALALMTGVVGFCGLYVPFGICTAPRKQPGGHTS